MKTNPVIEPNPVQHDRTTIVCRIRNRNEIFADTIRNWLKFPVPEIIVVDFRDDGCQSVWNIVRQMDDPRIRVIETKYEYMFIPTIAWNLGISQVASEYVLLLDVDNILYDHFFEANVLHDNEFICGKPNWHLWGSCLCKKEYIDALGGFNENCIYMGHADTNLYNRLVAAGHSIRSFSGTLFHSMRKSRTRSWFVISITPELGRDGFQWNVSFPQSAAMRMSLSCKAEINSFSIVSSWL